MSGAAPIGTLPIGTMPVLPVVVPSSVAVERILILTPRASDAATIMASSELTSLPATNLQTMQPSQKWRSDGDTEVTLAITLDAPIDADTVFIVGHNLSELGVLRVQSASLGIDTGWVSAWPSSGKPVAPDWPQFISMVRWSAVGSAADWQVDIADPSAETTYLEAGRLMLGRAWQPGINFDFGGTPLGFDTSGDVATMTRFGRTFTSKSAESPPRLFQVSHSALNWADALAGLSEIQRLAGRWGDVVCAIDPAETDDFHRFTMHGLFTEAPAYVVPPLFDGDGNMIAAAIKLRELL